ncbi:MAG: VanZ family protein [Terracidiphilus sp.]|nr:VanZ family protein [Terracidiphilus sp.]
MSSNRRNAAFWISTWWPVAVTTAVIAIESTQMLGADHTTGPLHRLFEFIFGTISAQSWDLIHFAIRKTGHFVGYGLVCLSWLRAWWRLFPSVSYFRCSALSLLGTFIVASADELHQAFLPNRGGHFSDVLLDCTGAAVLIFLNYIFLRLFLPHTLQVHKAPLKN